MRRCDRTPVTDDRPRIEHGPWVLPGEFERTPRILELQTSPPLIGADTAVLTGVSNRREVLHSFNATALSAYHRDHTMWKRTLAWVFSREPNNPYCRWFTRTDLPGR